MSPHFTRTGWIAAVLIGATSFVAPALRAAQDDAARKVIRRVIPEYPDVAKRWHLAGTVKMSATVAPNGVVRMVKTLGGNAVFVVAAEEAVKQWKYELSTKETTESIALVFKDSQ
jgi:outer membrane biosynthesis protein TonB